MEEKVDEAHRDAQAVRELLGGERLGPGEESPADPEEEVQGHHLLVGPGRGEGRPLPLVGVHVLDREGDLGAEEDDQPADVEPDQVDEDHGHGAVEAGVAGRPHLERDVSPEGELPGDPPDEPARGGGLRPDPGVGHEDVEEGEAEAGEEEGGDPEDRDPGGPEDLVLHQGDHRGLGMEGPGDADPGQDEEGGDDEDGEVVGEHPPGCAPPGGAPDVVEGGLDVAHHRDDREDEHRQRRGAQGGGADVADVVEDAVPDLQVPQGDVLHDPGLEGGEVSLEGLGQGEGEGEEGDQREDGDVGEGGGPQRAAVLDEAADDDGDDPDEADQGASGPGEGGELEDPDVAGEKRGVSFQEGGRTGVIRAHGSFPPAAGSGTRIIVSPAWGRQAGRLDAAVRG